MKRTKIEALNEPIPSVFCPLLKNAELYDSSCSPEARVFYIARDGGYYLKRGAKGSLEKEAELTRYFHQKGLGTRVLDYVSHDFDWLLTARVLGEDCTHAQYLENPTRLCDTIAECLRALHERDFCDCPVQDRMKGYFELAEKNYQTGNYDTSAFSDSFGYSCATDAYAVFLEGKDALNERVLLHGDYCLPNIMLDDWRFSGFIDLGNGGVGDRHVDLFWGAWTLRFNLKTDAYRQRFFDAYGNDRIDRERLRLIGIAECFG